MVGLEHAYLDYVIPGLFLNVAIGAARNCRLTSTVREDFSSRASYLLEVITRPLTRVTRA